ncbi:hypothetical protein [Schlesneria paludicola]|uniref:hypothetical protein n=1 Tax=Schlesneria paludicola TaxID=360056 RepID=UPI00138B13D3|nr:hypothetical protein [Schlesneria paludicola]
MAAVAMMTTVDVLASRGAIEVVMSGAGRNETVNDKSRDVTDPILVDHMALASRHIEVVRNAAEVTGTDPIDTTDTVHSATMVLDIDMDTNSHKGETVTAETGGTDRMGIDIASTATVHTRGTGSHIMDMVHTADITTINLLATITSEMVGTTAHGTIVDLRDIISPGTSTDSVVTAIIDTTRISMGVGILDRSVDTLRDVWTIVDSQDLTVTSHHMGPYLVELTQTTTERLPKTKS